MFGQMQIGTIHVSEKVSVAIYDFCSIGILSETNHFCNIGIDHRLIAVLI